MSALSPCDLKLHLAILIDMYIYKQNLCLKYHKFEGSQNEKREMSADWCHIKGREIRSGQVRQKMNNILTPHEQLLKMWNVSGYNFHAKFLKCAHNFCVTFSALVYMYQNSSSALDGIGADGKLNAYLLTYMYFLPCSSKHFYLIK